MTNKLFLPLRINWNTRREIWLRCGIILILISFLLTGFIGGQGVGEAQAYYRVSYGYISKAAFNERIFIAGWLGFGLFGIIIMVPLGLIIIVNKATTLKHTIWFNYGYSVAILGLTLGLGIYGLLIIANWYGFVFIFSNALLLVGFNVLLFFLNKEIKHQWQIRSAVDYISVQNKFQVANLSSTNQKAIESSTQ